MRNATAHHPGAVEPAAIELNRITVDAYERYARNYALLVGDEPSPEWAIAMRRLHRVAPPGQVLEVGSGAGVDADFLEDVMGRRVRRTDATAAFLRIQAERGKRAELLNVMTDPLDGPYAAIVALCVLIHVPADALPEILRRMHAALVDGGGLLISMREGEGVEHDGPWYTVLWHESELLPVIRAAGFRIETRAWHTDSSAERWLTYVLVAEA